MEHGRVLFPDEHDEADDVDDDADDGEREDDDRVNFVAADWRHFGDFLEKKLTPAKKIKCFWPLMKFLHS